jgi:hypothetical protein
MRYHPERFVDGMDASTNGELRMLLAEKTRWIETPKTPENAREKHQKLHRVNAALQGWIQPERELLLALREESAGARRADEILTWREYAACLYPETVVREGLSRLLG